MKKAVQIVMRKTYQEASIYEKITDSDALRNTAAEYPDIDRVLF
jgi:hypothetical protein